MGLNKPLHPERYVNFHEVYVTILRNVPHFRCGHEPFECGPSGIDGYCNDCIRDEFIRASILKGILLEAIRSKDDPKHDPIWLDQAREALGVRRCQTCERTSDTNGWQCEQCHTKWLQDPNRHDLPEGDCTRPDPPPANYSGIGLIDPDEARYNNRFGKNCEAQRIAEGAILTKMAEDDLPERHHPMGLT